MSKNTKKYLKKPQAETEFWSYNYYISKAGKVVSEPGKGSEFSIMLPTK